MSSLQQNNTTKFLRFLTIVLNLCLHIKRKQNPGLIFFFFFFFGYLAQVVRSQVPHQGSNPCPLRWKHEVLTTQQSGKSLATLCFTGVNSTLDRNDIMPSSVLERERIENSLAVQWLGHHAFTAGGLGSIPGWRIKIYNPYGWQKKKKPERTHG